MPPRHPHLDFRHLPYDFLPRIRNDNKMHARVSKLIRQEDGATSTLPLHVAYLFRGSKLVATARNDDGVHAEVRLMSHMRRQGRYRVYVTRIHDNAMSRPCSRCSACLRRAPCASLRVFYTNTAGEWIEDADLDSCHVSRRYR